jgi:hypothetical protein
MTITLSEAVTRLLPSDDQEANALVNEILEQALSTTPPELQLANRPEWQEKYRRSQDDTRHGRVFRHEDVVQGWTTNRRA